MFKELKEITGSEMREESRVSSVRAMGDILSWTSLSCGRKPLLSFKQGGIARFTFWSVYSYCTVEHDLGNQLTLKKRAVRRFLQYF